MERSLLSDPEGNVEAYVKRALAFSAQKSSRSCSLSLPEPPGLRLVGLEWFPQTKLPRPQIRILGQGCQDGVTHRGNISARKHANANIWVEVHDRYFRMMSSSST